jgi:protein-L-isoaspartate(D-aspartate) O-methyltransferase
VNIRSHEIRKICLLFLSLLFMAACQTRGSDSLPESTSPSNTPTLEQISTSLSATVETSPTTIPPTLELTPTSSPVPAEDDEFVVLRSQMVDDQIALRDIDDPAILEAMRNIPRHKFVPDDMVELAYEDHPLPIGYGQTISQPFIVALMTQTLKPEPGQRILEIGTGSGYQAAVLAELGVEVYTIEIIPELADQAAKRLEDLGYTNIHTLNADGYFGWEEFAPFDAVIVTAAPDHLPQPLANQLIDGGRLVIPIGPVGFVQTLWLFERVAGEMQATNLGGVTFVPFTRDQ